MSTPEILWKPDQHVIDHCNLTQFMKWLKTEKDLNFNDYDELWKWSVSEIGRFWEVMLEYFQVKTYGSYEYVRSDAPMPDTEWFSGLQLNYAEHVFRSKSKADPAIIFNSESIEDVMTWGELEVKVAALADHLRSAGVKKGDRVVAFIPGIPEATIGFLAACSIGAVWSACSPDFGVSSVVDRFKQIEPKVLITVDGYTYGGKDFDKKQIVKSIIGELPSLEEVIQIPYLDQNRFLDQGVLWSEAISGDHSELTFEPVPFSHPIWVLYSSGTTGQPKAITHSQGGVLLEHLKYVAFHNDVKAGERYFWYTTTGWMMWNFVQATLLVGATIVLYDGSPAYPGLEVLWQLSEKHSINHFGTSAPFIMANLKAGFVPKNHFDLSSIRSLSSTGAPLPPEGFDWVHENVGSDIWLVSMSGGTDVCSAFVGGCPLEPVYKGEIQRRALGCSMKSIDEEGKSLVNEVGEMVITEPMPSMPVYFWNDPGKVRYKESYFDMFPNIWRHGDWLEITDRNTLIIKGRSDATLNRHGIRIGTAEIYRSVDKIKSIKDSLVVNIELENGDHFMPLFLVMHEGEVFTKEIEEKIANQLKNDYSPRHVPDRFVEVKDIPYTLSGKKMETAVKKILQGKPKESAANLGAMRNPESLDTYIRFFGELNEN